jgi:hypothetical protein
MPHTKEFIKKMWYLYTMEFYSATKKNEIFSFASELDGPGEHHLKQSFPGSEDQKSHSSSYTDYRPKTNAVILLDMGHTLKGEYIQEE